MNAKMWRTVPTETGTNHAKVACSPYHLRHRRTIQLAQTLKYIVTWCFEVLTFQYFKGIYTKKSSKIQNVRHPLACFCVIRTIQIMSLILCLCQYPLTKNLEDKSNLHTCTCMHHYANFVCWGIIFIIYLTCLRFPGINMLSVG